MAQPRILRSLPLEDHRSITADEATRLPGSPVALRRDPDPDSNAPPIHLGRGHTYERGRTLLAQGSDRRELFVVRRGLLREAAVSIDGRWFVHGLLGPGDIFGSLTRSGPAPASVRTLRPSEVITMSRSEMDAVLRAHPAAAWWLLTRIERRARDAQATSEDLAWYEVPARVRRRLLLLARRHGRPVAGGVRIDVMLTQEDLGSMVGAARETVNRALVSLISTGSLRVEHRRYVLRDSFLQDGIDDGDPLT